MVKRNSRVVFASILVTTSFLLMVTVLRSVSSATTNNGTTEIYSTFAQQQDSSGDTLYVQATAYLTSGNYIIWSGTQHLTAGNGHVIAGGDGTPTSNPTWPDKSGFYDPAFYYPPDNAWISDMNTNSIYPVYNYPIETFTPDNTIQWEQTGTVTVSYGISGTTSATFEGAGTSATASYDVSYSWNIYAFMLEPTAQTETTASWLFSDNQGFYGSSPLAAQVNESASVHAVLNTYNAITSENQAQFLTGYTWWGAPEYTTVSVSNFFLQTPWIS